MKMHKNMDDVFCAVIESSCMDACRNETAAVSADFDLRMRAILQSADAARLPRIRRISLRRALPMALTFLALLILTCCGISAVRMKFGNITKEIGNGYVNYYAPGIPKPHWGKEPDEYYISKLPEGYYLLDYRSFAENGWMLNYYRNGAGRHLCLSQYYYDRFSRVINTGDKMQSQLSVNGRLVDLYTAKDHSSRVAIWQEDEYFFVLSASEPVSEEDMLTFIEAVKPVGIPDK